MVPLSLPVCLLNASEVIKDPWRDPSGPFANAATVKDGYHLSFLNNISNLALGMFHLTSPQLLCGTWRSRTMNLNETSGCRLCVLGRSEPGKCSRHYIKACNQPERGLFTLWIGPYQSYRTRTGWHSHDSYGRETFSNKKKNYLAVSGCFRLFTCTAPLKAQALLCRVINRKFISRYISSSIFPLKD